MAMTDEERKKKAREYSRVYYQKNKEYIQEWQRKYYQTNKEHIKTQNAKYRKENNIESPDYINPKNVSDNEWEKICSSFSDEN